MTSVVFVGPLWPGSTSEQRLASFRQLGIDVRSINFTPGGQALGCRIASRIAWRAGVVLDLAGANARLIQQVTHSKPEIVWIEKGLAIRPDTLREIKRVSPSTIVVSYSPDDMYLRANQSRAYRRSIPWYDWHVTHKSYNVQELKSMGAKRVYYTVQSYDRDSYRPRELSDAERERWGSDVAFLGGFEAPRFETMLDVAEQGVRITIWGPGWEHVARRHENLDVRPGWVQADDAAKVFCGTKVNLHFLRKVARDLHTTRSVEIPACGAFMLAERTSEHLSLFDEGREADFFSSTDELVRKIRLYLGNYQLRLTVARAGLQRCLSSGYSNCDQFRTTLDAILMSRIKFPEP